MFRACPVLCCAIVSCLVPDCCPRCFGNSATRLFSDSAPQLHTRATDAQQTRNKRAKNEQQTCITNDQPRATNAQTRANTSKHAQETRKHAQYISGGSATQGDPPLRLAPPKPDTMNKVDTLGIEPRAFRMRSGCDTAMPCALGYSLRSDIVWRAILTDGCAHTSTHSRTRARTE